MADTSGTRRRKPRTVVYNGVAIPTVPPVEGADYLPRREAASSDSLRRQVRRGDDVVVVGGGWGITTVVAARMTHFEGSVTTYEANSDMLETLRRAVEVNRVADLVSLHHATVGPVSKLSRDLYGEADGDPLPPAELPDCDVLELDCEGAELHILEELDRRPRCIVVETHPPIGITSEAVIGVLEEMAYRIVDREATGLENRFEVLTALDTRME